MSNTYQRYKGYCSVCGKELPKREMNKIFIGFSQVRYMAPKTLCSVCDDCLPMVYDTLGIIEPDREAKSLSYGKPREFCRNCYNTVGKTALFCPHCGKALKAEISEVQDAGNECEAGTECES